MANGQGTMKDAKSPFVDLYLNVELESGFDNPMSPPILQLLYPTLSYLANDMSPSVKNFAFSTAVQCCHTHPRNFDYPIQTSCPNGRVDRKRCAAGIRFLWR
jgi:hypothetical protein